MKQKLSDWASMAEILGAAAVVLSLIFVGYEIRQSSESRVQTTTQALVSENIGVIRSVSEDGELACIYTVGSQDFNGMGGAQRARFSAWMLSYLYTFDRMMTVYQQGEMEESAFRAFDTVMRDVMRLAGPRQWYELRAGWLSEPLQAYLDEVVAEPLLADPVYFPDPQCAWVNGE